MCKSDIAAAKLYYDVLFIQVLVEFEQMCGEEAVELMRKNWTKYTPQILALESEFDPSAMDEAMNYKVMDILEKRLRPPGPSGKGQQAFSYYEVS